MAVSIRPETITEIGGIAVTNSLLTALIVATILILFLNFYSKRITVHPRSNFQLLVESFVGSIHDLAESIMGKKITKQIFPFIFTFFILILSSNFFGLLPFSGSIGAAHHVKEGEKGLVPIVLVEEGLHTEITSNYEIEPIFRSPSADLNFTIAMALISFFLIQITIIRNLGLLNHLGKFFDYRVQIGKGWKILMTPVMFLINVLWKTLELILEISKIISFSFRLFGSIFAGEVLLFVITSLSLGLLTLPFLGLEIFIGFIQAIVFIFLTMVFIKVGTEAHH